MRWEQVGSVEVCTSSPWWEWPRPPPSCSQRPAHGQEITNENLAWKLQQQLEFTKEEWELLKVPTLSADSYIKVGDQYFKPAETPMSAAEQALWASLFLGFVALALLPPSVSAPSSAKHSQRLEDERRLRLEDERRLWPSAPPLLPHGSAGAQRTGTYSAQYTERGSEFNSTYVLHFDADGRVTGKGSDPDGVLRFPDVLCVCACARACVVPLCVCVCLSVFLSVCLSVVCLSVCLPARMCVCTCIRWLLYNLYQVTSRQTNPLTPLHSSVPAPLPPFPGNFEIDGGVYDALTGRVAWGEWTKSKYRKDLYSEITLYWDGKEYRGKYESSSGRSGSLVLRFESSKR